MNDEERLGYFEDIKKLVSVMLEIGVSEYISKLEAQDD